jgi:hypothetical protein
LILSQIVGAEGMLPIGPDRRSGKIDRVGGGGINKRPDAHRDRHQAQDDCPEYGYAIVPKPLPNALPERAVSRGCCLLLHEMGLAIKRAGVTRTGA